MKRGRAVHTTAQNGSVTEKILRALPGSLDFPVLLDYFNRDM